jgi:hypothetical protein
VKDNRIKGNDKRSLKEMPLFLSSSPKGANKEQKIKV